MQIDFIDIQNFRKLRSVRIKLANKQTIFVGANNSGKTTAMHALEKFLKQPKERKESSQSDEGASKWFVVEDFTLSNWEEINQLAFKWESLSADAEPPSDLTGWDAWLPTLDVWLKVESNEYHHVYKLIPTLDWNEGYLGIRLRLQPKDISKLYRDYRSARSNANNILKQIDNSKNIELMKLVKKDSSSRQKLNKYLEKAFWPQNMHDFLQRRLDQYFAVFYYELDPAKFTQESPQALSQYSSPKSGDPFSGLIRIDSINAQRDLNDADSFSKQQKLASQFSEYFKTHLNPQNKNIPSGPDIDAIIATCASEVIYNDSLQKSFEAPIHELENLNYPNINNPEIKVQTKIQPKSALSHSAAVQYSLAKQGSMKDMFLPESYNGLGYQNLIFMVFKLMRARDGWMRVNREEQYTESSKANKEPIHLVFIEEPEAHLHAQVQQVFIRKAYDVLRQHDDLKNNPQFTTQLIVSTHSPHIAHECEFAELRYFQRIQKAACPIPESRVISLATVFGEDALATPPKKRKTSKTGKKADESAAIPQTEEEIRRLATRRFVTRYLQTTHCDIFFADAVILVEGAGERILLPHFLKYFKSGELFRSYIAILEIGGSHAFRLRELIECLGLPTLIITDIDAAQKNTDSSKPKACPVQPQQGQVTTNSTLKKWIPQIDDIDSLLNLHVSKKIKIDADKAYKIRVAYQKGIPLNSDKGTTVTVYPRTFEDAFIFSNLEGIQKTNIDSIQDDCSQLALVQKTLNENKDDLETCIFNMIEKNSFKKAEFALEMLFYCDPQHMVIPKYMEDGFSWLYEQLSSDNA